MGMTTSNNGDWEELEQMLEQWVLSHTSDFETRQSLIPIRNFIFDRTTDGKMHAEGGPRERQGKVKP